MRSYNMDLKEFIKTALVDIVSAVRETQEEVKEYATIAPLMTSSKDTPTIQMKDGVAHISNIDFDVAVITETKENTENGINAGIKVAGIFNAGGGFNNNATDISQNVSRIRFSIPVLLPCSASLDEIVSVKGANLVPRRKLLQNNADL